MHIAILIAVAFIALWLGIVVGLLVTGKREDKAMAEAIETLKKEKQ
jgi:hypothetical protein